MPHLSQPTLTHSEQKAILRATACNPRDHVIYSLALRTGPRLAEIVGLQVGDVYTPEGRPRNRLRIRAEIAKGGRTGDVFLPVDPLFCSQSRTRTSKRRVQFAFRTWQVKAGFDRLHPFHALRHTAVTNVYRASRDLFLAQRFARHVSPLTTTVTTHPSDQEKWERVRGLSC